MSDITLIHGDCLQVMRDMPDNSVDAVVTDPPYNAKKAFMNDNLDDEQYKIFILNIVNSCEKIANTRIFFTGLINLFVWPKPKNLLIWTKLNGTSGAGNIIHNKYEPIACYGKIKNLMTDVFNYPIEYGTYKHPTQKPLKLMKILIAKMTDPGATILDPFMGSGTTGVACVQTGRNFIGIEIDEKYYNIAQRRIKDALQQPGLFA